MSADDRIEDSSAPLIEHLAELRTRLIRSVMAFVVAMVACFAVAEPILNFISQPLADVLRDRGEDARLIFTAPQEKFFVLIRISIVAGFAVSFPVIAHQLWRFVAPGLYRSEKSAILPFLVASPILFTMGAAFAHYVVTPLAMNFFIGFSDAIPALANLVAGDGTFSNPDAADNELQTVFLGSVRESLDLALKFIFAFGLCFQLPVLLTLLGKAGLVTAEGLGNVRKYAVVGILVLAALVTPPDVITQLILFTVVYGLYEISIQLVRPRTRSAGSPRRWSVCARRPPRRPTGPLRRPSSGMSTPTGWSRWRASTGWTCRSFWGSTGRATRCWQNTRQFAKGLPANNALLWGARGMGKSSLVKAVHAAVAAEGPGLKLVEMQREDLPTSGGFCTSARRAARVRSCSATTCRSHDDQHYKSLKAVLDGGVEGRPDNVVFYATSNRRHLMPRDMIENERSTAINPSEAVEEKVSLSDRFGLWLGFHPCRQDEYLAMIDGYCAAYAWRGSSSRSTTRRCAPRRSNGRRRAARARAGWPGNSSPISPGRAVSTAPPHQTQ
jgi:sec-independent protein translocase protein TatC